MIIDRQKYKALLGFEESRNRYNIENSIGALGKYQFMPDTLNGLQNTYNLPAWKNAAYFLSNPNLQEKYIDALIADALNFIERNNLKIYFGRTVSGSMKYKTISAPLNVYGMLAGAHLSGVGNLKRFLESGYNPNDGNTSLSDYAALFSSKITGLSNTLPLILAFVPAIVLYYIQ